MGKTSAADGQQAWVKEEVKHGHGKSYGQRPVTRSWQESAQHRSKAQHKSKAWAEAAPKNFWRRNKKSLRCRRNKQIVLFLAQKQKKPSLLLGTCVFFSTHVFFGLSITFDGRFYQKESLCLDGRLSQKKKKKQLL